jgi:hypothetical protein
MLDVIHWVLGTLGMDKNRGFHISITDQAAQSCKDGGLKFKILFIARVLYSWLNSIWRRFCFLIHVAEDCIQFTCILFLVIPSLAVCFIVFGIFLHIPNVGRALGVNVLASNTREALDVGLSGEMPDPPKKD